jgi:hypothetical protein
MILHTPAAKSNSSGPTPFRSFLSSARLPKIQSFTVCANLRVIREIRGLFLLPRISRISRRPAEGYVCYRSA